MTTTHPHLDWLESQHHRILGIIDGLDEDQLRSSALPSGWSPLAMVVHVREGMRFWAFEVMHDQHPASPVGDDFAVPSADTATVLDSFRAETARARSALAALPLDAAPAWWPEDEWGGWRLHTMEEVLLHLLVETACHAGHLDVARELLDGATWDYATNRVTRQPPRAAREAATASAST